jgi:prepilin-type processing-associated H-X9-DG protein
MAALTTLTRLLIVREVQENTGGAVVRFQDEDQGRLDLRDPNYKTYLRLAQRSQERQHPVGVSIGDGQVITELIRADNDVPMQLLEQDRDCARVLFQGHDGVFRLRGDHPESDRIRALLGEALRQRTRVWFLAQKPDLSLLDAVPAASPTPMAEERVAMPDEKLGITANVTMLFAFPRDDGKWTKRPGNVSFVDGHFHKIIVPGLETRSGESFGITATFHVIQDMVSEGIAQRGNIAKFLVQNGRLMSTEVVAKNVEFID